MIEALALPAATALAKIVLDKFFDGAGKKLEETATKLGGTVVETANKKIMQLGELVWQRCFKGKGQDVDKRLEAAAQGSEADIQVLKDYIDKALADSDDFSKEVEQVAGDLHQVVFEINDVNAQNVQQNFDRQNTQVNAPNATVKNYSIGDGATITFNEVPD